MPEVQQPIQPNGTANTQHVAFPLKFSGTAQRTTNADMTAGDFLTEVKARAVKFGWTDEATMTQVRSAFIGEAHIWFRDHFSPAFEFEKTERIEKFSAFEPFFRTMFKVEQGTYFNDLDTLTPQKSGEPMVDFARRVATMISRQMRTVKVKQFDCAQYLDKYPVLKALVTTQEHREQLAGYSATILDRTQKESMQKAVFVMTVRYVANNLRESEFRLKVWDLIDKVDTVAQFLIDLAIIAHRSERKSNNGNVNKSKSIAEVSESNSDIKDEGVEAIGNKGKKSKGKGGKKPNNSTSSSRTGNGGPSNQNNAKKNEGGGRPSCNYCRKIGHAEPNCFLKEEHFKEGRLTAGIASTAMPPANIQQQFQQFLQQQQQQHLPQAPPMYNTSAISANLQEQISSHVGQFNINNNHLNW